jgi:transposase
MSRSAADLPRDPAELRRFAAALAAEVHAKKLLIEKLQMQLSGALRAVVGEARPRDRATGAIARRHRGERRRATGANRGFHGEAFSTLPSKKPSVRKPLPDHLPLETVMHEAPCVCPTCGATKFGRMGTDERMVLEYVPSHFKRVLHVRRR